MPKHKRKIIAIVFYLPSSACVVGNSIGKSDCLLEKLVKGKNHKQDEQKEKIMMIRCETSLENFQAWSGGKDTLERIIMEDKCAELENILEEMYPDGMTDTELNDFLWFDSDTVFEWLGIRTYDQIKDELDEAQEELEDLLAEYQSDIDDEDLTEEEKQEIYAENYEYEISELKDKIAELEEELDLAA